MPRVHHRKARKDYPDHGIAKGDMYYTAKIKLQRGNRVVRSLKPLRPSQLTNSPFKSGYFAAQEEWDTSSKKAEDARGLAEALADLANECQESFENMPEGLQQGDTGQMLENRASECESKQGDIEGFADELECLVEPDFDRHDAEPDNTLWDDYDEENERIQQEIDDLIGDMPE